MGVETAIAAIATTLGVTTTTATVLFVVGANILLTGLSTLITKNAIPGSPELQARTFTSRGTVDPQRKIYGRALVAGTLAYHNAHGIRNRDMWAVHVLAGHECEAILDVYLDDKQITNAQINGGAAAGGAVTAGDFGPVRSQNVVELYKHLGTSTQAVNASLDAASTDWTTAHRLRGYTYGVSMFRLWDRTERLWEGGDPRNVKWLVDGAKVYDPRLDSTRIIDSTTSPVTFGSGAHRANDSSTWAWSDNPALCWSDCLIDAKFSPLVGGIDPERIDWESVASAADVCDTLVVIPPATSPETTEKRFTCNGDIYATATPEENLERILSAMNGSMAIVGGKYVCYAGSYTAPASGDDLNEDDIIGPLAISNALSSDQRVNTMKAKFIDPTKSYEVTETAPITFSAYKDTRDGGDELIKAIDLPMTNSWYMAQRICQLLIQEGNEELTLTVPCNLYAARFVPGQRINVNIAELSWAPKIFKVLSWEFFDRGGDQIGVNLSLREDSAAAYADPLVGEYNTVDSTGVLTLADPEPVPSIDTIPEIGAGHYGEGAWNINLTANADETGAANDGEVRFEAGSFVLPGGTVRTLSNDAQVNTPYEGSEKPPDGTFYIVWGATNPDTRFGAGVWGDTDAEAAGLFCAILDRIAGQWYAVENGTVTEYAFTMLDTDYVVARGVKTSSSGGIDGLIAIVPYVDDPQATAGATWGVNISGQPADADLLNALQEWAEIQNREVRPYSGENVNDWNTAHTSAPGPTTGIVNLHVRLELAANRFHIYASGRSAAAGSTIEFDVEVFGASFTSAALVTDTTEGDETPIWQASDIDFSSLPGDNVWAPNGITIRSTAWGLGAGTNNDGAGFTLDSLTEDVVFRLRIHSFNVTGDISALVFGDTVIEASRVEENAPIELFFAARDTAHLDALRLTNAPAEAGATDGADVGTNLRDANGTVITDEQIATFDDATALRFNSAFALYGTTPGAPDNWALWSSTTASQITREASIFLTANQAVRISADSTDTGIQRDSSATAPVVDIDFPLDSILIGSFDCYVVTNTSGGSPGVIIDLMQGANYRRKVVEIDETVTGRWQRYYFKVSVNDFTPPPSGPPAGVYDGVRFFLMGSWSGFSGGHWTGTVIFDNIRFAVLSPDVENESQLWADISGVAVDTSDVLDNAVTNLELAEAAGPISADTTSWVTLLDDEVDVGPVVGDTDILVLVNAELNVALDESFTNTPQLRLRVLGDDLTTQRDFQSFIVYLHHAPQTEFLRGRSYYKSANQDLSSTSPVDINGFAETATTDNFIDTVTPSQKAAITLVSGTEFELDEAGTYLILWDINIERFEGTDTKVGRIYMQDRTSGGAYGITPGTDKNFSLPSGGTFAWGQTTSGHAIIQTTATNHRVKFTIDNDRNLTNDPRIGADGTRVTIIQLDRQYSSGNKVMRTMVSASLRIPSAGVVANNNTVRLQASASANYGTETVEWSDIHMITVARKK